MPSMSVVVIVVVEATPAHDAAQRQAVFERWQATLAHTAGRARERCWRCECGEALIAASVLQRRGLTLRCTAF